MSAKLSDAETYYREGRFADAERLCEEICRTDETQPRVWHLLAMIAYRKGSYVVAAEHMAKATNLAPDASEILCHASEVFRRAGWMPEAVDTGRSAVELQPDHPAPLNNLGLALLECEEFSEAEDCFRNALEMDNSYVRAYLNLGNLFLRQDRLDEAEKLFRTTLQLRPDYPEALNSFGQLLRSQGKPAQALDCFRRALQFRPGYSKAWLNLAITFSDLEQNVEAERQLRAVLAAHPNYSEAFHDWGAFLEKQRRLPEAAEAYRRAEELKPDSVRMLAPLENIRRQICDWSGWPDRIDRLLHETRRCLAQEKQSAIWPLASFRFPTTSEDQLAIARQHAARTAARVRSVKNQMAVQSTEDTNPVRLRIGFLSHEFRYHVVTHLTQGLYPRFDRDRFEIIAFDYSRDDGSAMRRAVAEHVDRFVVIKGMSQVEQAQKIAAAGIHILIDINSNMPDGRPEIAACRPAPIQVSHLYPGTTGADFIDYLITDRVVTPPGYEHFFTEKLVYLPDAYLPTNCDQPVATDCPSRKECGLPDTGMVFCSFNKVDKIDPELFDAWMRILHRVPESVLWLRDDGPAAQENLRMEASRRNIAAHRLVFAPQVRDMAQHLARQRNADLFLDTLIHGAHGTAVDALWAGLPLLTCPGKTFASRVAASLLTNLDLSALIADDLDTYEWKAIQLATDKDLREKLTSRLRANRFTSAVFDTDRYVRHLEKAFEQIWKIHQTGRRPQSISVL